MARKLKLGLFLYNDDVGVVYYIQNLVKSLNSIEKENKPSIILFYTDATEKHLSLFSEYKDIQKEKIKKFSLLSFYLNAIFLLKNPFEKLAIKFQLNGAFPILDIPLKQTANNTLWISWVTDFQHKHYPRNFSFKNRFLRNLRFNRVLKNADAVVLSSKASYKDLLNFYPKFNGRVAIMQFVSEPSTHLTDLESLLEKYTIKKKFFLISNQFYKHKNHTVVFEAIKHLDQKTRDSYDFVFTGKTEDYRDPKYYPRLEKLIEKLGVGQYLKVLGLIPREEQLLLMKNCKAIIQPSFFEGWNTSIEDAKHLTVPVICSDIDVHYEQMGDFGYYFNPNDSLTLVESIQHVIKDSNSDKERYFTQSTDERKNKFAKDFINLFDRDAKV
jgi:glycosyltransferase involved in cell wall biosynthesis